MKTALVKATLKYKWDSMAGMGLSGKLPPAEIVAAEIERIRAMNGGKVRPDDLIEAAKVKTSPLHGMFKWNVKEAAWEHWLHQARTIINSLRVVRETGPSTHAYFSVRQKRVRFYAPAAEVASNESYMEQLMKDAESYYLSGRIRFDEIKELVPLHAAIDQAFAKVPKVRGRKSKAA